MQELSYTEENYLKAIYSLSATNDQGDTSTNAIAAHINIKPGTVTEMLKRLMEKGLVSYEKYKRVHLTKSGRQRALKVIRKHRLWETFLHQTLGFNWDEVHEVAEQMEHIQSDKLIDSLANFLGNPRFDPHGDPIPDEKGKMDFLSRTTLHEVTPGKTCKVVAVKDSSTEFLHYLHKLEIKIGSRLKVIQKVAYDDSLLIANAKGNQFSVSAKFSENLLVSV